MKTKKSDESDRRKLFVLYFFGVVALLSIIGTFVGGTGWMVKIGLLIITVNSMLLMFYTLQENPVDIFIQVGNKIKIVIKTIRGVDKFVKTIVETKPHNAQTTETSENENKLLEMLHLYLEKGLTEQNVIEMTKLLEQHNSTVNESWKLTADKSRLLALQCQFDEADELAKVITEKFSDNDEAVSVGYEVHSWIEEFREPSDPALFNSWLEKRLEYINKGLAACPNKTILWLNGFEVLASQKNAGETLNYLNRAVLSDKEFTSAYLKALLISNKGLIVNAKKLSPEIKEIIEKLIGGEN